MNKLVCLFCFFIVGCTTSSKTQRVTNAEGYTLVWSDEFNVDGAPDTASWRFEKGFVRNEELQWYQEENAYCKDGLLIIEARKEERANPLYKPGTNSWRTNQPSITHTSSSINTSGKQSWLYGRFEMRGKIDIRSGLWPAWWTLGVKGRWPANGEIDIMEYYRGNMLANIACAGSDNKPHWFSNTFSTDSMGGSTWANSFHVWRMDWTQQTIALYLDDIKMIEVPVDSATNKDGSNFNPFRQPHYMLLNLAMGGMNGGDVAGTPFPNRFEVDYVRVYQKKGSGSK